MDPQLHLYKIQQNSPSSAESAYYIKVTNCQTWCLEWYQTTSNDACVLPVCASVFFSRDPALQLTPVPLLTMEFNSENSSLPRSTTKALFTHNIQHTHREKEAQILADREHERKKESITQYSWRGRLVKKKKKKKRKRCSSQQFNKIQIMRKQLFHGLCLCVLWPALGSAWPRCCQGSLVQRPAGAGTVWLLGEPVEERSAGMFRGIIRHFCLKLYVS